MWNSLSLISLSFLSSSYLETLPSNNRTCDVQSISSGASSVPVVLPPLLQVVSSSAPEHVPSAAVLATATDDHCKKNTKSAGRARRMFGLICRWPIFLNDADMPIHDAVRFFFELVACPAHQCRCRRAVSISLPSLPSQKPG